LPCPGPVGGVVVGEFAVFGKVFFPALSGVAATLASFATLAVGFVVRPIGAIVFGHLGDRIGDITEHPTEGGKVYCAAVMDAYSRLIIGWSIADHMRTELVTDALGMAILRRKPADKETILHSDHGAQYTSWAFGQRLRTAGLLASMGTVGDCYDNAMMESFWGAMQLELLDTKPWKTRQDLANAIFEWIECWYNPKRRHSSIGMHAPVTVQRISSAYSRRLHGGIRRTHVDQSRSSR
jgi:transposase InsO family protein